jgi:hypothetical protein
MGDTWITDMTHFLDTQDQPAAFGGSRRIAKHFGAIVSDLTTSPPATIREVPLSCRRRPKRKACPGKIHAGFEPGTTNIIWSCPVCNDRGLIHHWQNTIWDKGGRVRLPQISKITYRHGFLDDIEEDADLDETILDGAVVSHDIILAIHDNEILGTGGVYGDPTVGDPLQIDQLEIEHPGGPTKITLYNRAIMLFATNDEFYVQMHRVCCAVDKK